MTDTVELTLHVAPDAQDIVSFELSKIGFDAFMQGDTCLKAYLPAPRWTDLVRTRVVSRLEDLRLKTNFEQTTIAARDWNTEWEDTMLPMPVGRFLIKPTWAEIPPEHSDRIIVEIDPKMSFGTGHHESTRLVLRILPGFIHGGELILDAGAGTGILTIAALKLGAASAVAFDIDPWAQVNIAENLSLNHLTADFRCGDVGVVPESGFDVVLANINRNVLVDLLPILARKTRMKAYTVLSGLLLSDRALMLYRAAPFGFVPVCEKNEGDWWSVVLQKNLDIF